MSSRRKKYSYVEYKLAKQKRNSTISAIAISLLVCALVVSILWSISFTKASKNTNELTAYTATVSEKIEKVEDALISEMVDQVDKKPSSPSSSIARVIAATTPTPTAVPVFDQVLSDPSIDFGSINDFGDGWGSGGGDGGGNGSGDGDGGKGVGRGGGDTALFFGKETSKKLGVVLDISGSTRKSLPEVLEVLSKDFKDAQLVSTISGGLHRIEAEYTVYNIAFKRRNMFSAQEEAFYNIMPKELLKVSHKLENNIIVGHGENKFGCLATGVDYLARSGLCQEIYIFSDFADGIGPGVIEGLKEVLKSKRIKLNCLWVGNSKSSHSLISKLCSKTKGSFESFEFRRGDTVAFDIR